MTVKCVLILVQLNWWVCVSVLHRGHSGDWCLFDPILFIYECGNMLNMVVCMCVIFDLVCVLHIVLRFVLNVVCVWVLY